MQSVVQDICQTVDYAHYVKVRGRIMTEDIKHYNEYKAYKEHLKEEISKTREGLLKNWLEVRLKAVERRMEATQPE